MAKVNWKVVINIVIRGCLKGSKAVSFPEISPRRISKEGGDAGAGVILRDPLPIPLAISIYGSWHNIIFIDFQVDT